MIKKKNKEKNINKNEKAKGKRQKEVITSQSKKRVIFIFAVVVVLFTVLALRVSWHILVKGDEYSQKASKQQTADKVISAERGSILDRNGVSLAVSVSSNTVWVRPSSVKSNGKTDAEIEQNAREEAQTLAEILGMDADSVYETITAEKTLVKLAKKIDDETAATLRAAKLTGIEIVQGTSRSYPLGAFASQILGITNDDNNGTTGLEYYYNNDLSGIDGRWITSKDNKKESLVSGVNKYYDAEDGYVLVTTIDSRIQQIVEDALAKYKEETQSDRMMCLIMDPSTGEILAMAQTDEYDPNNPRVPLEESEQEKLAEMSSAEQVTYWNKMWRNFCICDTYEPGSTFKLITTAIVLDTGEVTLKDKYECTGQIKVANRTLHCWYYPRSHGVQTLDVAVGNSCNPVMVQIVQKIGKEAFLEGLDAFCLHEKTGVDYPGEAYNQIYDDSEVGPVELATMSYGQGIALTPISLVSAVASLANDGKLMQPHFMKQLLDSEGNVVEEYEPVIKSITVSAETAADMLSVLETSVQVGGAGKAKISGYRIGGKTGTANKVLATGGYSEKEVYGSFIGVAPLDDPQFVILVIADTPKGKLYGSQTAAPCAKEIMEQLFQLMDIEPQYTEAELAKINSKKRTVPDLSGKSIEDAIGILAGEDLEYNISPALPEIYNEELVVTDQYPKAGSELTKGDTVTLYYE